MEVQDTAATPEPVTELGEILVQVRPVGILSRSVIRPANPPIATTLIVEFADSPTGALAGDEIETVKSGPDCVVPDDITVLQ